MANCCICASAAPTDGNLIDGSVFHRHCYEQLNEKLSDLSRLEMTLLAERQRPVTFGKRVALLFSEASRQTDIRHRREITVRIQQIQAALQSTKATLVQIHDVWPGYPPDWNQRREYIRDRDDYCCAECGVVDRLQLHHRRPIRQGGTHRLENLVLLCASCHSEAHGGKEFKYRGPQDVNDDLPNAFEKKLALINKAIAEKKDVHFRYKKRDGTITERSVTPRELRKLSIEEIQFLIGDKVPIKKEGRLCLFGYCHLRRDKRTFAIDRIYKLRLR